MKPKRNEPNRNEQKRTITVRINSSAVKFIDDHAEQNKWSRSVALEDLIETMQNSMEEE